MPRFSALSTAVASTMDFLSVPRWRWLATLILLLLASTAVIAEEERVVLVLGDSLSAAYNMDAADGWVHLLDRRLAEHAPGWRAANASISGDTTRGGLSRLPRALETHDPAVVIVALGGNDGLRGIPPAEIESNLAGLVNTARDHGAEVLLAGVRIPPNYGPAYSRRFEQSFHSVAETTGAELLPGILDGIDENPELFMDDGIHPTPDAQHMILDNVWSRLEPMLED